MSRDKDKLRTADDLRKKLRDEIALRTEQVASGRQIANFEEYQKVVGIITGLTTALEAINELMANVDNDSSAYP